MPHGAYVADFLCFAAKLIVEVDGASHADSVEQDAVRTRYFEAQGYQILRVWNHEVMENIEGVVAVIAARLSPSPSHA